VFSVHPGNMVSTDISRNYWFYRLLFAIVRPFTKSLVGWKRKLCFQKLSLIVFFYATLQQQAAATSIYCATANELTGLSGLYFNNCFFCEPSQLSKSASLQQQLWQLSENLISELLEEEQH